MTLRCTKSGGHIKKVKITHIISQIKPALKPTVPQLISDDLQNRVNHMTFLSYQQGDKFINRGSETLRKKAIKNVPVKKRITMDLIVH